MPVTVSTISPAELQPAAHPDIAKRDAGRFDASLTLAKGTVLAKKTSNGKLGAYVWPNAVQTMAIAGTLSAGGFRLSIYDKNGVWQTTALIAYNANAAAIQSAINAVIPQESSTNQIVVGGTDITGSTFTFSGASYAAKYQPLMVLLPDGLTGMTTGSMTDSTTYTGLQVPVGILTKTIKTDSDGRVYFSDSTTESDTNRSFSDCDFFINGIFDPDDLTGWDADAATALKARTLPSGNIYIP